MSLVLIAIGIEGYQLVAHAHCLSGRTLPGSHRTTLGFGTAIAGDALSYLLACVCLHGSARAWPLLLVPLLAHLVYWCLLAFFRPLYLRIHDYRLPTIYSDNSMVRGKRVASFADAGFHLLALVLLAREVAWPAALSFAAAGLVAYAFVFAPGLLDAGVERRRAPERPTRIVQKEHA